MAREYAIQAMLLQGEVYRNKKGSSQGQQSDSPKQGGITSAAAFLASQ